MNLAGISVLLGLLALAWVTMPYGLLILLGLAWLIFHRSDPPDDSTP